MGESMNHLSTEIASIAATVLKSTGSSPPSSQQIADAVKTAIQLLDAAKAPPHQHAYELFQPGDKQTIKEIADRFDENNWHKMGSYGTVLSDVKKILSQMHQDIQLRQALIIKNLRKRTNSPSHLWGGSSQQRAIRDMLRKARMDNVFGPHLDIAVNCMWQQMLQAWVSADQKSQSLLGKLDLIDPFLFSEICVDTTYEKYCESQNLELTTEDFQALWRWLGEQFRDKLTANSKDAVNILTLLNEWLQSLSPGNGIYFGVFAELLVELRASNNNSKILMSLLDEGLKRVAEIMAAERFHEFIRGTDNVNATQMVNELAIAWEEIGDEMMPSPPLDASQVFGIFDTLRSCFFPVKSASLGNHFVLVPRDLSETYLGAYFRKLGSLSQVLAELSDIARQINRSDILTVSMKTLQIALQAEIQRCHKEAAVLGNPSDPGIASKIEKINGLMDSKIKNSKNWAGHQTVKPYFIFKYAHDRGVLVDKLFRERPGFS
jgi:hypothetical protein